MGVSIIFFWIGKSLVHVEVIPFFGSYGRPFDPFGAIDRFYMIRHSGFNDFDMSSVIDKYMATFCFILSSHLWMGYFYRIFLSFHVCWRLCDIFFFGDESMYVIMYYILTTKNLVLKFFFLRGRKLES